MASMLNGLIGLSRISLSDKPAAGGGIAEYMNSGSVNFNDYYKKILDNLSGGMQIAKLMYDDRGLPADYEFLEVNSVFAEIMGIARDEIIGKRESDFFPDTDPEWFFKYGEIVKSGRSEMFEVFNESAGRWYNFLAVPLGNDIFATISRDVTEQKKMQKNLRIMEELQRFQLYLSDSLRLISDAKEIKRAAARIVCEHLDADCAMYNEITDDGRTIHIEDSYSRFGTPMITGDFRVGDFGAAMDVLRRGEPLIVDDQTTTNLKKPHERQASTNLGVYASMTVPLIKEGRWTANFGVLQSSTRKWKDNELAVLVDAAERTWAAVERAKSEAALRESEEKFRSIVETAGEGISQIDTEGRIVFLNKRCADMMGYTPDELLGRKLSEFIVSDSVQQIYEDGRNLAEGGVLVNREYEIRHKSGNIVSMICQVTPLFDKNGRYRGSLVTHSDVTAYRRLLEAQRKIQERYRAFVDASSDVIFRMNPDCTYIDILRGKEYMPEIRGPADNWLISHVHPDDRTHVSQVISEAIRGRSLFELELRIRAADGSWARIFSRAVPLLDAAGKIEEWFGTAKDISLQKETEKAFKESEEKYRALFEAIDICYVIVQPTYDKDTGLSDYIILEGNPAWENQTDLNARELIGKRIRHALRGAQPSWCDIFARVARTGTAEHSECYSALTKKWYELHAFPFKNGLVGVLFRDIMKRRQDEIERQVLLSDYQVERDRLRALINNFPDRVWFVDRQGDIIITNKSVRQNYATDYIGVNITEVIESINVCHPDGRPHSYSDVPIIRALNGEDNISVEETVRSADNSVTEYCWTNAAAVRDSNNEIIGAVAVVRNITDWKQAEITLQQSEQNARELIAELEAGEEHRDWFISVLSHELRNPLAVIRMNLDLQKRTAHSEESAERIFRNIERQTEYLTRLIDDILEVTRIRQNKVVLKKEKVDLNKLGENLLRDYQTQFDKKGVRLEFSVSSSPLMLEGDPVRLSQAIGNLLHNALKFTSEGGTVKAGIHKDDVNAQAVIYVEDSGEGISPKALPLLFQPFMQADNIPERGRDGLGLGLAIIKGIAELHGGSVEAASEGIGKGARFTIRLPLGKDDVVKHEVSEKAKEKHNIALRILVIEDNKELAEIVCEFLALSGHQASAVHTGAEGVAAAKVMKPDVIISDIGLPDISGYEAAMEIRKSDDLKNTVMIAISGYTQAEDKKRSIEAGFDMHLGKPVDSDILQTALDYFITKYTEDGARDVSKAM